MMLHTTKMIDAIIMSAIAHEGTTVRVAARDSPSGPAVG